MNTPTQPPKTQPKNITASSLLAWVVGVLLILVGFLSLFTSFFLGLGVLLSATIILPPVSRFIREKLHLSMTRKAKLVLIFIFLFGGMMVNILFEAVNNPSSGASVDQASTVSTPAPVAQVTAADKLKAKQELDDLMQLAFKAKLATSYEFSESAAVVYAGSTWYTQTVGFKKDFLAKVGILKKTIMGYSHFEVRDAYSNEKVAEITSFTSSLEVYK